MSIEFHPLSSEQKKGLQEGLAMTDDLVDTRTDTPREFVVPEWTGVRIPFDTFFMHDLINLERCDSRSNRRCCDIQNFSGELQTMCKKGISKSS